MSATQRSPLELAREAYRTISLYAPNREPARVDVSDNTNLWGIPPAAARVIAGADSSWVTRYPALYTANVKRAIADYVGVSPDMIVTGCGSDDVLDSTIRAFGEPGDVVAFPDPSFAMIPIFATMNGLRGVAVPLTDTYDANPDLYREARAKISYVCSPNNPTGKAFSRDAIERIVQEARGIVIIDEAYAEFAGHDCLDLMRRNSHVLVARTFSKAFGLAGLRVGYAAGDPALVAEVEKSRGPYKVNAVAEHAAVAALTQDRAWVAEHAAIAVTNRERLIGALCAMGLAPLPSDANFVLVPVPDAHGIDRRLREAGIAVRPFVGLPRIGDALRISVGPWPLLEDCLEALEDALGALRT